ncbi:BAR-domain-containing protein [Fistulina hepatica ATCC 64428]|uniref:BAR-domain-containing protein n=1 Tax=Fistulina hepatica ATCC 64428 TaxID=1128425 RepID=A0A0D7A3E2_9AGAR|nr:BAR-domain-containing protein [Fistulina hepatica ATCC 64428]
MKGFTKAIKRTPHMLTSKVGMSKKSTDPEFDEYERHFSSLEKANEKLLKDAKTFSESVSKLFTAGAGYAQHFAAIFTPMGSEYDLLNKYPEAEVTVKSVNKYEVALEEMRSAVVPELELIESRIVGPVKELQTILKLIRKSITKREHKLVDYDRFNNSLTKLRDKKEKTLSDEKNLFKLEQDFEVATTEYEYMNNALKTDLPRFMTMATQFIDPLFHSFFYMQLQIYYLLLEKLTSFGEQAKFEVANMPSAQIIQDFESRRGDMAAQVEQLDICKRGSSLNRASSSATTSTTNSGLRAPPPVRSPSATSTSSFKKAPPPPPGASFHVAPPPYTPSASTAGSSAGMVKRAPPPPPPLKPKPKSAAQYVVALYDFDAQADGDLSFRAGDRIEIVQKSANAEDWWTGKLNGQQGVFPGNYVQET